MRTTCSATNANSVTFLKDGEALYNGYLGIAVSHFDGFIHLIIKSVDVKHVGNYTCLGSNREGSSSLSSMLTVSAPPTWIKKLSDERFVSMTNANIECLATGYPQPLINWYKGERKFV